MKQLITASLLVLLLTGCATSFQKPTAGTGYGAYPSNYQELIKGYMETSLIDPESARYRFGTPRRAYANQGLLYGGKVAWTGYAIPFFVNAKNRLGGYTGGSEYVALIRDGTVFKCQEAGDPFLLLKYAE